jgi:predicted nuclease of predicted toxin-antitoxin system
MRPFTCPTSTWRERLTQIVARAKREGRTVITADLDYSRLLALTGAMEPSLILFRGGDWTDADVIARVDDCFDQQLVSTSNRSVFVIERNRVRRRRLPILD